MTQMIPVSNDLYAKLQQSAQRRGLQITEYLEMVVDAPERPSKKIDKIPTESTNVYERIMKLREDIAQDMQGKGPFDVEAWIREDRDR